MTTDNHSQSHDSGRQTFTSSWGIILSFVGVAVGLGNVWRFPYMAGAFGGGAFLLIYFILLGIFGIPALVAECTLGRLTRRGPLGAFRRIKMKGGTAIGWLLFITVLMATSYYSVVVGWVLKYLVHSIDGQIFSTEPGAFFNGLLGGFTGQLWPTAVVMILAGGVLLLGIKNGIERVSRYATPLLFLLFVVLLIRSVTLPGAVEGLKFYLVPDLSKIDFSVVTAALGQVFFSLALGGTFILTYASYLPDDDNIVKSAVSTGLGDGVAAVLAGFVVIPAAVASGIQLDTGPSLTFITMPEIFSEIPGRLIFSSVFFFSLLIAAFLSAVAAFEVLVTTLTDELGWSRKKSVFAITMTELVLAVPSMLSLDYLLGNDLIWGSTMQPLGSALAVIGLTWVVGRRKTLMELHKSGTNDSASLSATWYYWCKYVVPIGIGIILLLGLKDLFETFFQ